MSGQLDMPLSVAAETLPVIDIGGLRSHGPDRRMVAARMRQACEYNGFFYISGHGIEPGLIEAVFAASREFVELPLVQKRELDLSQSRASRGYEPLQSQTLEAGTPPDLKEGFYIGVELPADHPRVLAGEYKAGPNQWPAQLPEFRKTMDAYFARMIELSALLMRGLALSLELDEDFFDGFCRDPLARLRLLHYPPQPATAPEGQKGVGAHTDFGGLTVLLQDSCGGLQVFDRAGNAWIHADPLPGTYVVNLGDLIARWTNDRYQSTLHRVVNSSGRERYSIPFFFHGNPDYRVACLPTCRVATEASKYPETTVVDHFEERYRRSYKAA